MRTALIIIFFAVSAFAQDEPPVPAACGPKDTKFKVKLDESNHALALPEPGKARVYFIQHVGRVSCLGACFKTKIGVERNLGGRRPGQLLFFNLRGARRAPYVRRHGTTDSSYAFHRRSRQGLLFPHSGF